MRIIRPFVNAAFAAFFTDPGAEETLAATNSTSPDGTDCTAAPPATLASTGVDEGGEEGEGCAEEGSCADEVARSWDDLTDEEVRLMAEYSAAFPGPDDESTWTGSVTRLESSSDSDDY
ncbi:MAG: hypothetical protein CMF17_11170 [Idiomarinaceae bacterium]|nr:hypothetical protein [Idiomarinaceae bacterium]